MTAGTATHVTIDEDTFIADYRPLPNPLDLAAGFDFGGGGCLLETYGADWEHVCAADPAKVWTVLDGDNDTVLIASGRHLVNRIGYILTERPVAARDALTVVLE
jgi:hypothetical protein